VMDKTKRSQFKSRLGDKNDTKSQKELQDFAQDNHKQIVSCLGEINNELLLVLKTNNYLRAIDRRLGNPNNTFTVINDVSFQVYKREVATTKWQVMAESLRYYLVRIGLLFMYVGLRVRILCGLHFDPEALQDFDLDVVHEQIEIKDDSLMGIARQTKKVF
jgi:hypothetical protein